MTIHYDMIAIGAGSGGLSAVERASEYGKKCAVIEVKTIGGTCVNVGCVPQKVMWFAANTATQINSAKGFGFDVEMKNFSWKKLKENMRFFAGYSGWEANQLEDELKENSWILKEKNLKLSMRYSDKDYWSDIIRKMDKKYALWANFP